MSNTFNNESENQFEELTDAELAQVEGGSYVINYGYYLPSISQQQIQVAAGNYGYVTQIAEQSA